MWNKEKHESCTILSCQLLGDIIYKYANGMSLRDRIEVNVVA